MTKGGAFTAAALDGSGTRASRLRLRPSRASSRPCLCPCPSRPGSPGDLRARGGPWAGRASAPSGLAERLAQVLLAGRLVAVGLHLTGGDRQPAEVPPEVVRR